METISLKSN